MRAALHELESAGVAQRPETVLADASYWHKQQVENIVSDGIQALVPPDGVCGRASDPDGTRHVRVRAPGPLKRPRWRALQAPKATVEPVFAQNEFNRGFRRFQRRGRAATRSEWRLQAATHNLLKLHGHWIAAEPA